MDENESFLRTSVTEISSSLIVAIADEMSDEDLSAFASVITTQSNQLHIKGVILNFSMVQMLDTFSMRMLHDVSKALQLMGVKVVWVGLKPGVVISLIDLGIDFDTVTIQTALNLEQGLELLAQESSL